MTNEDIKDELYRMLSDVVNGRCPIRNNTQKGRYREAVKEAIKALEQEPRWIPVSERLPEDHKDVLICLSSDEICIGCYNSHRLPFFNNVIGWGASYAHNWCSNDVKYWMPLPAPPNKSEIPTGSERSDKE